MQYAGEAWVERLRAGVVPRARGVAIAVVVLVVAGVALTVLEWSQPRFLAEATVMARAGRPCCLFRWWRGASS